MIDAYGLMWYSVSRKNIKSQKNVNLKTKVKTIKVINKMACKF